MRQSPHNDVQQRITCIARVKISKQRGKSHPCGHAFDVPLLSALRSRSDRFGLCPARTLGADIRAALGKPDHSGVKPYEKEGLILRAARYYHSN